MARLQKYNGKGKDEGKAFYRIQPYLPCGRRVTIRLGTGQKRAEKAVKAIEDLIESSKENVDLNASTKAWVEAADAKLLSSLHDFGLINAESIAKSESWTLEKLTANYIRLRGTSKARRTIEAWERSRDNLFGKFGKDCKIAALSRQDGREFFRWLIDDCGYSPNTAKQRLRYARSFFEHATEDQLIEFNPFKIRDLSVTQTAAKKSYVPTADVEQIIEQVGNPEWKLLFALCRKVPIRVPSEIHELTWNDIDWEKNQILIHSPKTRSIGKSARLVPLFADLKPHLDRVYFAELDATYVFPSIRKNSNPATYAKKLVEKAKVKVWSNFFNSLRASAETDLMDECGLRRACQWAGNNAATAMKNYALVRKEDFMDQGIKVDAKCAAITSFDAKCAAESASMAEHGSRKNPTKNALGRIIENPKCVLVGETGIEPARVTPLDPKSSASANSATRPKLTS